MNRTLTRTSITVATLAAALALTTGCGDGATQAGEAPSTFAAPGTSVRTGSGETGSGTGGTGRDAPPAAGDAVADDGAALPASAGNGRCLDLGSSTVRNAVASLPKFRGTGYTALRGTDAKAGDCPALMWAQAELEGGTGSSPEWILFFDRQGYLGTATGRYTTFTSVVGSTDRAVAVSYRWLNPGDATAGASGGPVVVTYTLQGRRTVPDKEIPREVFEGGSTPTSATTATATATTEPPVSHCAEATPEALRSNAEANWGSQIAKPFTVDSVVCVDDWAAARIPAREAYPQNTKLLFHYTGGGWSGVGFGSGFSCIDKGVPAATAARLAC